MKDMTDRNAELQKELNELKIQSLEQCTQVRNLITNGFVFVASTSHILSLLCPRGKGSVGFVFEEYD